LIAIGSSRRAHPLECPKRDADVGVRSTRPSTSDICGLNLSRSVSNEVSFNPSHRSGIARDRSGTRYLRLPSRQNADLYPTLVRDGQHCSIAPAKMTATPASLSRVAARKNAARKVPRSIYENARDVARHRQVRETPQESVRDSPRLSHRGRTFAEAAKRDPAGAATS
jgi:hypothetical protein